MSFAGDLKNELCLIEHNDGERALAECYGMAITSRGFDANSVTLVTESRSVAERYAALTGLVCGAKLQTSARDRSDGSSTYTVSAAGPDRARILSVFGHTGAEPSRKIRLENIRREELLSDFIRGVYLSCGSISDPNKSYHLELAVPYLNLSRELAAILEKFLCGPKQVRRRGDYVLYYKESENIEDFLTFIGAPMRALEIMEIKVVKDVRNQVNRRTNCETANIDKTVAASSRQVADIEFIRDHMGMEHLPENLREIALLRLEGPEMSLAELGNALSEPISRSGVNHRLERISRIAGELRSRHVRSDG